MEVMTRQGDVNLDVEVDSYIVEPEYTSGATSMLCCSYCYVLSMHVPLVLLYVLLLFISVCAVVAMCCPCLLSMCCPCVSCTVVVVVHTCMCFCMSCPYLLSMCCIVHVPLVLLYVLSMSLIHVLHCNVPLVLLYVLLLLIHYLNLYVLYCTVSYPCVSCTVVVVHITYVLLYVLSMSLSMCCPCVSYTVVAMCCCIVLFSISLVSCCAC